MKNSLEDLLKQVYEQKEMPSQEFYQTVLQGMKEKERKASFWKKEVVYQKGILVAACMGMAIIVGLGVVHWQRGLWNRKTSFQQNIAEREDLIPAVTDDPVGAKNRVDTEGLMDTEDQGEMGNRTDPKNQAETGSAADSGNEAGKQNAIGLKNETGADQMPGAGQKRSREPDSSLSGETDPNLRMPGQNPTAGPGVQNTGGAGEDADTDSGNRKLPIQATAAPKESFKPSLPSGIGMPQNTPRPQDNYISLCSIETYSFSESSSFGGTDDPCVVPSGDAFSDRLILSYEKLQSLILELENCLSRMEDDSVQKFLMQLQKYDQNYFNSNALCVSMTSLHAGTDLKLSAVKVRDMGRGDYCLDIWLDIVDDGTEQSSDMLQYSSLISVPQNIAGRCSTVQFYYSD